MIIVFLTLIIIFYLLKKSKENFVINNKLNNYPITKVKKNIFKSDYPIFVNFYTGDNGYGKYADKMIISLNKFNLPYYIFEINSLGNKWEKICQQKPYIILKVLNEYKNNNVVWIDADAIIEKKPELFMNINKSFAVHYVDNKELNSAVLFFKNDNISRIIIKDWIKENNKDSNVLDQVTLGRIVNKKYKQQEYNLPKEYCSIFDKKGYDNIDRVISQWQASRELKYNKRVEMFSQKVFINQTKISNYKIFDFCEYNIVRNKKINYLKNDSIIGKNLKNGKYWEEWMLKYFKKYYIPNTNAIDLGANIGTASLLLSEIINKNKNIYSFEPVFNDILLKNVKDNNLESLIKVYPYGLSNKKESIYIENIDYNKNINFGGTKLTQNKKKEKKINLVNLDSFNFRNVSLIKIDVEHMEKEVLEGSFNLLKHDKPVIILESYLYRDNKLQSTNIFKKIIGLGYTINKIPEGSSADYILVPSTL